MISSAASEPIGGNPGAILGGLLHRCLVDPSPATTTAGSRRDRPSHVSAESREAPIECIARAPGARRPSSALG